MKKSIAHIVTRFPSISEAFVVADINAMRNIWHENHIFAFFKQPGVRPDWIDKVYYFPLPGCYWRSQVYFFKKNPRRYLSLFGRVIAGHRSSIKELMKVLAAWPNMVHAAHVVMRNNIDAVHAHWANIPATTAFIISRLLQKPFTCTGHAHDIYKFNAFLHEILKSCDLFLTSTNYNRRHLLERFPDINPLKIRVYSHGVDLALMRPVSEPPARPPFVIASIGRMTWQKGFPTMLKALRRLIDNGFDIRLDFLALSGDLAKQIKHMAQTLELQSSIRWIRPCRQEEVVHIYHNAHAFVLPCEIGPHGDRDGIPNVILEASACGLPCISTPISGIPEAVSHGETGILVAPRDFQGLAAAIAKLYENESIRQQMGKAARLHMEHHFDRKVCQARIVSMLKEIYE